MDWFSAPLTHIWGIPIFWVVRIAKILQFVSALVIVIDIVGKERVENFAGVTKNRLKLSSDAFEWLKKKDKKIVEKTMEIFPDEPTFPTDPETDKIEGYLGCISIIVVIAIVLGKQFYPWLAEKLVWILTWGVGVPMLLCFGATLILLPFFFGSLMFALVNVIIIYPVLWILNLFTTSILRVLENKGLTYVLLVLSLCLLTLGFVFDLIAS